MGVGAFRDAFSPPALSVCHFSPSTGNVVFYDASSSSLISLSTTIDLGGYMVYFLPRIVTIM